MHEGHRERMIKKLLSDSELSDHELLEILLFYSIPRKNVNETAHEILNAFGDIRKVFNADEAALKSVNGVGERTAAFLVTIGKCMRICEEKSFDIPPKFCYEDFKKPLIAAFKPFTEEKFAAFYLDASGNTMLRKIFSSHSSSFVEIDTRDLIKGVLLSKPKSVVICHNHLSGETKPSYSDDKATKQIHIALRLQGVNLVDHIIVSGEKTYSYNASGRLNNILSDVERLI